MQISVERLGDILDAPTEGVPSSPAALPPAHGSIATLPQVRDALQSHGTGSKAAFLTALQDLQRAQASLVGDRGQRGAALGALSSEKAKALGQFRSDSANKAEDASNKAIVDGPAPEKRRSAIAASSRRSGRSRRAAEARATERIMVRSRERRRGAHRYPDAAGSAMRESGVAPA